MRCYLTGFQISDWSHDNSLFVFRAVKIRVLSGMPVAYMRLFCELICDDIWPKIKFTYTKIRAIMRMSRVSRALDVIESFSRSI